MRIAGVSEADLADLLPLMRGYCDFYQVAPSDSDLLALSRSLLADPDREGFQLLARDDNGRAIGFATVFWSWSTLAAARTAPRMARLLAGHIELPLVVRFSGP